MDVKPLYILGHSTDVLNIVIGIYETYEDAQVALTQQSKNNAGASYGFPGLYITSAPLYPSNKSPIS